MELKLILGLGLVLFIVAGLVFIVCESKKKPF